MLAGRHPQNTISYYIILYITTYYYKLLYITIYYYGGRRGVDTHSGRNEDRDVRANRQGATKHRKNHWEDDEVRANRHDAARHHMHHWDDELVRTWRLREIKDHSELKPGGVSASRATHCFKRSGGQFQPCSTRNLDAIAL